MRRLLKFLLCWSPSLHVPHFFDWHTYVKRPNLQWRPSHKSLWHLSIGAAAASVLLVLLLLWKGIHAQPTAINSPDAKLAAQEDLGPELPDDPFAQKPRTAETEDDPFAPAPPANSNPGNSDDEMFATLKPKASAATDAFDAEFAPPIKVSQEEFSGKPVLTINEPEIEMEAKPAEEPAEPEPDLLLPVEEPKIALESKPAETPAEPDLDPEPEPKIALEAPQDAPAEPDITADLEPIMPTPEPKIALDEKPEEMPAEPEEEPAPPAKTLEVALAPMPEIAKTEPVDEEPPAAPFKVVQVAQANRPNPFAEDDDGPPRKSATPKPIQKPQAPPRGNPMDDSFEDDLAPPKKPAVPAAAPNRPRPMGLDEEENDPMSKPMPKAPAPIPKPIDLPPEQPTPKNPMGNNPMADDDGFPMNRPAANTVTPAVKQNSNVKIRDLDEEIPASPPPKAAPVTPKAAPATARPNPFADEDPMGVPRPAKPVNAPTRPVVQTQDTQEFPDKANPPMPQPPPNSPMPQQQKPRPSSQIYDEAVAPQNDQMKPKPELRIEILSAPEAVVGGPVVLSFRIANVGRIPATGVLAIDALPPELRHPSSQRLEYRIGRLNPGESRSTQLRLTAAQAGLTINRASVSSDEGGFAEGSVKINVLDRGNRPNYQPNPPPGNCEPVPYQYILTPQPDCCVPY